MQDVFLFFLKEQIIIFFLLLFLAPTAASNKLLFPKQALQKVKLQELEATARGGLWPLTQAFFAIQAKQTFLMHILVFLLHFVCSAVKLSL